jgi:hypothetical protein
MEEIYRKTNQDLTNYSVRVGTRILHDGTPAGYFQCSGAAFDTAIYAELAGVYPAGFLPVGAANEFVKY